MNRASIGIVLVILIGMLSGCTGDSDDQVEASGNQEQNTEPEWINERGLGVIDWNISLDQNQWLEIYSSLQIINYPENDEISYPMLVQMPVLIDMDKSTVGNDLAVSYGDSSHSPFFGGDYHSCGWIHDGVCYDRYQNEIDTVEWTIIYRIHQV